jgi:PleD family two-component response regulator
MKGGAAAVKTFTGYHSGMVLAVVDDLFFGSKFRSAAAQAGAAVVFVRTADAVLPAIEQKRPAVVIFDLDRDALDPIGAIRAVRERADIASTRLIAFVRHTSTERIADARAAGIDLVLARSAFFPALTNLLAGNATGAGST